MVVSIPVWGRLTSNWGAPTFSLLEIGSPIYSSLSKALVVTSCDIQLGIKSFLVKGDGGRITAQISCTLAIPVIWIHLNSFVFIGHPFLAFSKKQMNYLKLCHLISSILWLQIYDFSDSHGFSRPRANAFDDRGRYEGSPWHRVYPGGSVFVFFLHFQSRWGNPTQKHCFWTVCERVFSLPTNSEKITALHLELQLPNVNISAWRVPREACGPFWSSARMVGWAPQKCKAKGGTWNPEVEVMPQIGLMGSRLTIEINQLVLFCLFTYIYI